MGFFDDVVDWGSDFLFGDDTHKDLSMKALEEKRKALKRMRKWGWRGHKEANKQYRFAEQAIRGNQITNVGNLTAGLSSSGMLGSTMSLNAGRAAQMDAMSQLRALSSQKSREMYSRWMDRAEMAAMTEFDGMDMNFSRDSFGLVGDAIGSWVGGTPFSEMFGG